MNNFYIDENATIKSILEALKVEGVKTNDIAKAIDGISEKPLRRALKEAGYEFSNKAPKGWFFVGDGEEPLHKSIFDYVKSSSHTVRTDFTSSNTSMSKGEMQFTRSNTEAVATMADNTKGELEFIQSNTYITEGEMDVNSPVVHPQFTQNETRMLLEMLHEWQQKKQVEQNGIGEQPKQQIHERIKQIPPGEKVRKTIVIEKEIGERLDNYCKDERVNKSDVLYLALLDFLNNNE